MSRNLRKSYSHRMNVSRSSTPPYVGIVPAAIVRGTVCVLAVGGCPSSREDMALLMPLYILDRSCYSFRCRLFLLEFEGDLSSRFVADLEVCCPDLRLGLQVSLVVHYAFRRVVLAAGPYRCGRRRRAVLLVGRCVCRLVVLVVGDIHRLLPRTSVAGGRGCGWGSVVRR